MNEPFIRHGTGIVAVLMLLVGVGLAFQPDAQGFAGMAIRVGCLLAVIWLAFDQIMDLKSRLPVILIAIALVCLLLIASKPNIGRLLISLVAIGFAVNGALRWLSKMAKPRR